MSTGVPESIVVEAAGRSRRVYLAGSGSPTVVFEPAIADVGLTWALVQPGVAELTATFTHDRPGLGGSEPASEPRTVLQMVRELRSALAAVSATPPFVLVGHSFASLTVRAFARQHPAEIAAIVLVDGAHEDQMARFPRELDPAPLLAGVAAQLRELAERAEGGEPIPPLVAPPASFPPELAAAYSDATLPTAVRLRTAASEYESLGESQAELRALGSPPWGFPLVALRHGIPQPMPGVAADVNERYEAVWRELQEELAARSTSGTVVAVGGAGHSIHHDRPDAVVEAIAGVLGRPIAGTSG